MAKKLAQAFLLPTDKKMVGKMELDEVVSQFYQVHNQVSRFECFYLAFIFFSIEVLT